MKTLILYESKTGNTKAYAEEIAKDTIAETAPLKHFNFKRLTDFETIVFGGWVMGGTIQGLNKFLQHFDKIKDKNVIIFSVGMAIPTQDGRALLIEQNLLDMYHVRFYQLRGSFNMKKLHFPYNLMIQNSIRSMMKNPIEGTDVQFLSSLKDRPIEVYDQEKIQKIVTVINTLAVTEVQ